LAITVRVLTKKVTKGEQVGCINGLAVFGNSTGTVIEIEACATRTVSGEGTIKISGIVEEEEMDGRGTDSEEQVRQGLRLIMSSRF